MLYFIIAMDLMQQNTTLVESTDLLDPALGALVGGHEIRWERNGVSRRIRLGGNLFFHTEPESGTLSHGHDFLEIMLVTSGALTHRVNGERQILESGNLLFIRPGDVHGFSPAPGAPRCEFILLDFELELFLTLSQYLENDAFLQRLTAPVLPPTFLPETDFAQDLGNRLLRFNSGNAGVHLSKIRLKILLAELMARFFLDDRNRLRESQVPDWLEVLCRKMRQPENFLAGLERMKTLACRTPEHLCKSFRRYLGCTPTEFINELKIRHAARLLADTGEEIPEIAARLQFESLSYFHRRFREQFRLTPAEYRRRYSRH